jgi:hypothetical protein
MDGWMGEWMEDIEDVRQYLVCVRTEDKEREQEKHINRMSERLSRAQERHKVYTSNAKHNKFRV